MTGDRQRLVFVTQHYPPDKGGNAARIHDVGTRLADQGWDVTVLAPPPSYPHGEFGLSWQRTETETVDGVTVYRLWSWQPRTEDPDTVQRLFYYLLFGIHAMVWLLCNARRYDVVVTTTPPISTGAPGLLAAALGKPWMVDVRDLWIDASISLGYLRPGSPLERVSRWFQRLVLRTADRIAVTTQALEDSLRETYGESLAQKTLLVPNGVDVEWFLQSRKREPRNSAAKDGEAPTIVYAGNLGSAQDLESCIHAMSHLSHDTAVLRLVGRGDVESELRRLTDELELYNRVEFVGLVPRTEVPPLLDEATIGVAPLEDTTELAYAMPTKVYEYMASGLPVVVTGQGEVECFIDESGGGVHVENDPEKIADRLDELLADDQRRRRLAENGREYVRANFDRKTIADAVGDELSQLVESAAPCRSDRPDATVE